MSRRIRASIPAKNAETGRIQGTFSEIIYILFGMKWTLMESMPRI